MKALNELVEPTTRGDPESPLRWTCKSTRNLAQELNLQGHHVGPGTVATLLKDLGYSLQANRKTREGSSHPDRNQQFEYINSRVYQFLVRGQPVVSVDTKNADFRDRATFLFRPQLFPSILRNSLVFQPSEV